MDWIEISNSWVLIPLRPKAIIHFLGGAFVASAPQLTYRWLLESLAQQGYGIIATPFINTLDHRLIAKQVLWTFEDCLEDLYTSRLLRRRTLPIYGLGHSMGCKLHLLIGSSFPVERAGNILMCFNNYAARESIPLVEQISSMVEVEFSPSPTQTNRLISERYQIRRNLLIQFSKDAIDQTLPLNKILQTRFPEMVTLVRLNGDHQTPLAQDLNWPVGQSFTPFDAIGQWVRQQVYQDIYRLRAEVLHWLNPLAQRL
ncbi:MAG: DUF1350 family protein [Microcoleaceae cyanobacterium]